MRIRRVVFLMLICAWVGFQQSARAQDSGLSFLDIGPDAASMALGNAGVATQTGAFASYWNPAGLAEGESNLIAVSHHRWIGDMRTYAASGKFMIGSGSGIGIFVTATDSGDLDAREGPGDPIGTFDAQFVSAGISYGRFIGPVRAGVALKYLNEKIFANSANGYAFDVGVQFSVMDDGLRVGAALQNVGEMEKLNVAATKLPRIYRLGTEFFPFRVLTSFDGASLLSTSILFEVSRNTVTEKTHVHVGVSGEVLDTVTARVGYITNDELMDFSAGLGLDISGMKFDYALIPFAEGFGGPAHILTLSYAY